MFVSRLADAPSILAFAAVITIVLASARKWRAMALVPLALVIEFACFGAVNYAVQRPRPDVAEGRFGAIDVQLSVRSRRRHGGVLDRRRAPAGDVRSASARHASLRRVGALMVVLVAWARVYLGMHYTLDTAVGIAMGVGALVITAVSALAISVRRGVPRALHRSRRR